MLSRLLRPPTAATRLLVAKRPPCAGFKPPPERLAAELMPMALRRRVAALEALHARFEGLEEDHHRQVQELERSFAARCDKLFARRGKIVTGLEEPTDEEVNSSAYYAEFAEAEKEMQAADLELATPAADPGGVPAFWPTVLLEHTLQPDAIEGFNVSDADRSVLSYLVDIRLEPWEPAEEQVMAEDFGMEPTSGDLGAGFAIHFTFAPNPMLQSERLALYCLPDGEVADVDVPTWHDPKLDPAIQWVTKKVRKKGGPPVKKEVARPADSFFRIFSLGGDEAAEGEDGGMLSVHELQEEMVLRLREDAIPRAAIYYMHALHSEGMDNLDDITSFGEDWEPRR